MSILSVLVLLLAGCHESADDDLDGDGGGGSGSAVVVGGVFVLSGDAASLGVSAQRGMELARDEINAAGGIDGKQLVVEFGDTRLDPTEATRVFQDVLGRGDVYAVVGALASGISGAVIPAADDAGVVLISPASTNADLTSPRQSTYFFRTIPSDTIQGTKAAAYVFQDLEQDSTVVMYQNNNYASGLKDVFVQQYADVGGTVDGEPIEFHASDVAQYPSRVQDAIARDPSHIWISGQSPEIAHLIKELRDAGYAGSIMASEAIEDSAIFEIGGDALDGVLFTKPYVDTEAATYTDFGERFMEKYGEGVGPYSAYAYDALHIIAEGIGAGNTNGAALRDHIQSQTFGNRVTATEISFNQNGDVSVGDYVLWEIDAAAESFTLYEG